MTAVLRLSHAALGAMAGRGRGGIINVSSVAAFLPRGTYSAAKAWVNSFGEWAAAEYRAAGGHRDHPVPRLHQDRVPRADGRRPGLRAGASSGWTPDFLVRRALADFDKGRTYSIPGAQYRAITGVVRVVPTGFLQRFQSLGRK